MTSRAFRVFRGFGVRGGTSDLRLFGFRVLVFGFTYGLGFWLLGLGFRVWGPYVLGLREQG